MRIKTIFLTAVCLICAHQAFAVLVFTDGDFYFSDFRGSECTLHSYKGAGGDVIIPSVATNSFDGATYNVTAIRDGAFYG
ncbi:MAG: hypothetical protein LBJ58_06045 [Tannerellaceae bacterium]|jgi:hypothetical protein|nr:hypothetical protein [Tannerellaceae bacterium]